MNTDAANNLKHSSLNSSPAHKVLVAPLNWGLGHATRCIPLIRTLLTEGAEVVIAADGHPLALLKQEFPHLTFIDLPGYNVRYPANGSMAVAMMKQAPSILGKIRREHKQLDVIIDQYGITAVISDNRYGMWTRKVPCVFMTHQLMIKCPPALRFVEPLLHKINLYYINRYTYCWVPDVPGVQNLSGELSHKFRLPEHASFIGPLSRFSEMNPGKTGRSYKVMAIVSGPEPQRSIFESLLLKQLKEVDGKSLLVRGVPGANKSRSEGNIDITDHLDARQMLDAMHSSDVIISRTGYSTVMDLYAAGKTAILVPTPGQTEQEYLARHLEDNKLFVTGKQENFILKDLLKQAHTKVVKMPVQDQPLYQQAIYRLLQRK